MPTGGALHSNWRCSKCQLEELYILSGGTLHANWRFSTCQQHTTLHSTAGLLLKLSRVGPGRSLDGRSDAAGSGVGGPVGGTLSTGIKNM